MAMILYRCADCGYRANVLGPSHVGGGIKYETMICRSCKLVVDSVVARHVSSESGIDTPGIHWQEVAAQCPHCSGGGLLPWPATRPCPRCGGEMDDR
ncbi:MAG: hypothetical protein RBT60_08315 [Candidatus Krumholzibacteria bacterium]|jgi:hypothetical protein|nr:hypothetical protein [Candidatus Krumholzibacteria bacterium]